MRLLFIICLNSFPIELFGQIGLYALLLVLSVSITSVISAGLCLAIALMVSGDTPPDSNAFLRPILLHEAGEVGGGHYPFP